MNDQNANGEMQHVEDQQQPGSEEIQGETPADMDYDEMDLTPYEDDDDTTLHKKLCAAKVARKRAEEDLKLLCNRIGLLKMEEGKVSTKTHSLLAPSAGKSAK
jgi:hypothetical protein